MTSTRSSMTTAKAKLVSAERLNTLGLGVRELTALVDFLDAQEATGTNPRREFTRWPFRQPGVVVFLTHPGGSVTELRLAGRNISRGGVSLLHNGFIHPGTVCRAVLPRLDGGTAECPGTVSRCIHRRGTLHEIGIKFDKPVHLKTFVGGPAGTEILSLEHVDLEKLKGKVLYADDSTLDTKIVQHFLRGSGLSIEVVGTSSAALAKAGDGYHLLVVAATLPDGRGVDLLKKMREANASAPALVVSAEPAVVMGQGLWEIPRVGLLAKPFTQQQLLQQIGELLLTEENKAVAATGKGGAPAESLAPSAAAIAGLADVAAQIEKAVSGGDAARAAHLCTQIKGSAPMLGLAGLAKCAEKFAATSAGTPEYAAAAKELVGACRRAAEQV